MTSDRFFPQLVRFLLTFFSETYKQGSTVPPSKVINKMCHEITPASRLATRAICSVVDYLIETTFCRMYWQQQNLLTRMKCDRVLFFFFFYTLRVRGKCAVKGKSSLGNILRLAAVRCVAVTRQMRQPFLPACQKSACHSKELVQSHEQLRGLF